MTGLIVLLLYLSIAFGETFIVKFKESPDRVNLAGVKVIKKFKNYALVEVQDNTSLVKALSVDSKIEYIVRNIRLRAFAVPNDPRYSDQWGLRIIGAEQAWDVSADCSPTVVAIIDSGVDYLHEDLAGNIWINEAEVNGVQGEDDDGNGYVDDLYGWDFVQSDGEPLDENGHGTHVAGIIGASGNNSVGIAGTCWKAKLMPVRILDASGIGDAFSFLEAVYYAVDNGAKVINTSLGTCPIGHPTCDISDTNDSSLQPLKDAIKYSLNRGVVIVAASGNDGVNTDTYPVFPASYSKDYSNVISVASIDSDGKLSSFSNYGVDTVDVAAPGGSDSNGKGILSTWTGNSYIYALGTSMATSFVTAEVAYLLSSNPNMTPSEVKETVLLAVQSNQYLQEKVKSGGYVSLPTAISVAINTSPQINAEQSYSSASGGGCSALEGSYALLLVLISLLLRRSLLPKLS